MAATTVRHFRQILLWPLRLMPAREGAQIQKHWELLAQADSPWHEVADEFTASAGAYDEGNYSEFLTFLPYVQRFLYGEGKGGGAETAFDSPIRIFRRSDIAKVRIDSPGFENGPRVFGIDRIDLYFFYDIDVTILVLEICADDLSLRDAQDTMFRFGRAYPTHWDDDGRAAHCPDRVEWLGADDRVLAVSDYERREKYLMFVGANRSPSLASHWAFLLQPMALHHSAEAGAIRYRQLEDHRMPFLAYLAMADTRALTRADFSRLALVTAAGEPDALPYAESSLARFEDVYCYDRYWHASPGGGTGTRLITSGQAFIMVGSAGDKFFVDRRSGMLVQLRHQYFLLYLVPHFHRASLLMLSDRLADALARLDIDSPESVRQFRRTIRATLAIFLRFTHRYWFQDVSEQPQARELFRMTQKSLENDRLYNELRDEIGAMDAYLDSDALRRQANTVMRLTVVTTFGLIGTVVTGFLGMNLIAEADATLPEKILYFAMVAIPVTLLTFVTLLKSQRLSDFLEALSDERVSVGDKLKAFVSIWIGKRRSRE